jgi:hypothetical protein
MADELHSFIKNLDKRVIDFWRETLTNLRQLHNDIWNGVRFFLTINGIVFAGFAALLRSTNHDYVQAVMLFLLLAIGIFLTIQARAILERHRSYYLDMLIRKTLIEKQLKFYDFSLYRDEKLHIDLSFPWQVDQRYLTEFISDIAKWRSEQEKRPKLITTRLFRIYNVTLCIYLVLGLGVVLMLFCGYFRQAPITKAIFC